MPRSLRGRSEPSLTASVTGYLPDRNRARTRAPSRETRVSPSLRACTTAPRIINPRGRSLFQGFADVTSARARASFLIIGPAFQKISFRVSVNEFSLDFHGRCADETFTPCISATDFSIETCSRHVRGFLSRVSLELSRHSTELWK